MVRKGYFFLAIMAMIFMGVADFLVKKAIDFGIDVNALMFLNYFSVTVLFGILGLSKKSPLQMDKSLFKYSLIVGVFFFLGTFAIITALQTGNASMIIPIARMGFVVTAICAFIFLREKLTLEKGLGLLFAVIALVLLSQ